MRKLRKMDTRTRQALKTVRIPTAAMLVAGAERFKAIWNDSDEADEHNLVAAIYEAMIDTAMND